MSARTKLRWAARIAGGIVALGALLVAIAYLDARDALGAAPTGARQARIEASRQWRGDRFGNVLPRVDGSAGEIARRWLFGGSPHASPDGPLPVVPRRRADFDEPPATGLRVTWLGHSTLIVELDSVRVLIDPVWGERASPVSWAGPRRWYAPPLPLAELPPIDVVVISHDHYDHLDAPTVRALAARPRERPPMKWVAPLGVGAHLEAWGVASADIIELDWWQTATLGALEVTCTPARHFSGRSLNDADRTLWAGWALIGPTKRVFYSGDTALHDELADIGAQLGPFDLSLIEVGAYDALWADVHLGPEQAVRAHQLVQGDVLLPVHWGLFDLALHGWTEPIERVFVAARAAGVRVFAPRPGEMVEPAAALPTQAWWPSLPWRPADVAPVRSSGVAHLQR